MKKRFTEEPIIGFLREAEAGLPIKELCRRHGFSEASYYLWRCKFGGMNEHWFTSLSHAKVVIEAWRWEYKEERPKKSLGGMTPSAYARQLATKAVILTPDAKAGCY